LVPISVTPKPTIEELRLALCALYLICDLSTKCHAPLEAIAAKARRDLRGSIHKALRRLVAMGLVWEKSHAPGRRSYGLTREGTRVAKELCGD